MGWYLDVIRNLHNDEYLIYIFTEKVENGTPIIFNKSLYNYFFKELKNKISPILINTTNKNVHVLNQINWKILRSGVTYIETINSHDLCYQSSKYGTYCLYGKSRIKDFNDEPHFPERIKLISSKIQINTLFKNND